MATFAYKALDVQGRQVSDKLIATDRTAAIEQICAQNLSPVVVERQEEQQADGVFSRIGRVSKSEVEAFTKKNVENILNAAERENIVEVKEGTSSLDSLVHAIQGIENYIQNHWDVGNVSVLHFENEIALVKITDYLLVEDPTWYWWRDGTIEQNQEIVEEILRLSANG